MWIQRVFLLSFLLLIVSGNTVFSREETEDKTENDLAYNSITRTQIDIRSQDSSDPDSAAKEDGLGLEISNFGNDSSESDDDEEDSSEDEDNVRTTTLIPGTERTPSGDLDISGSKTDRPSITTGKLPTLGTKTPQSNFENDNSKSDNEEEDSSEDEDNVRTTTLIPATEPTPSGDLDISGSKNDRPSITTWKLPILVTRPRQQPPTGYQKIPKAGSKRLKANSEESSEIDQPSINNTHSTYHRKKHLHPNTTSQSAQLVILVVGAVLACVLITGFIRWRVRRRISDRKLKKMSENYASSRGRTGLPKKSAMDTIYECECEEGLNLILSHGKGDLSYSAGTLEDGTSRLDEDSCSHRFDKPPSCTHCVGGSHRPDNQLVYSKTKHGHRSKHSRHHRRKSHDTTYKQRMEATPVKDTRFASDNDNKICWNSLLEQPDYKATEGTTAEQQPLADSPPLLLQSGVQPPKSILDSLFDTWQSLSFNRDWVGRRWLEKHNVRRISDVLRGRAMANNSDTEDTPPDSSANCDDVDNHLNSGSTFSAETSMLATIQDENEKCSEESFCGTDVAVGSSPNEREVSGILNEQNLPCESPLDVTQSDHLNTQSDSSADIATNVPFLETEPGQVSLSGTFHNFNDQLNQPPGYESLLHSGHHSVSLMDHRGTDHSRHHRRHKKKRSDDRDRHIRHFYRRVYGTDLSHGNQVTADEQDEHMPSSILHESHSLSSVSGTDCHSPDTAPLSTSTHHSGAGQEQNRNHSLFSNSTTSVGVSSMATPFVQQECIVIEQLSDGAQIIYLPPPVLPSYFSDTPPPYQQEP